MGVAVRQPLGSTDRTSWQLASLQGAAEVRLRSRTHGLPLNRGFGAFDIFLKKAQSASARWLGFIPLSRYRRYGARRPFTTLFRGEGIAALVAFETPAMVR